MNTFKISVFLVSVLVTVSSNGVYAQSPSGKGIGFGFSAGRVHTSLASANDFFLEEIDPFILNTDNRLNYQAHAVYNFGPYESMRIDVANREFSVATNYPGWPNLNFKNTFISTAISAELSIMRYVGIRPYPFNAYGKFGFGFNVNSLSSTLNEAGTISNSETSQSYSTMYTAGGGLRLHITSGMSLFTEYDLYFSNKNIIDSGFISDFVDTDFTQTSSRWSGLSAGLRITFSRKSSSHAPARPLPVLTQVQPETYTETDFDLITPEKTEPVSYNYPSQITDELTTENSRRFYSYSSLPFPFSDNDKFFEAVRQENRYQFLKTPEPAKSYGTNGPWNPQLPSAYTIIVHSLTSENDAKQIAGELQDSGLRTTVLHAVVRNISYYRVAIGQFTTRDDASKAANELASPLNRSFFVVSIPN
jgi:cell division septation protein DedD/opacity protein-like surface antigen